MVVLFYIDSVLACIVWLEFCFVVNALFVCGYRNFKIIIIRLSGAGGDQVPHLELLLLCSNPVPVLKTTNLNLLT